MQAILWGVLLLAFGLAGLVDRRIDWTPDVVLGLEKGVGHVHFRLPLTWGYRTRSRDYPGAVAIATEPRGPGGSGGQGGQGGPGGIQHTLVIYAAPVRPDSSATDYLSRSGLLQDIFGDTPEVQSDPATLYGYEGVRIQGQVEISGIGVGGGTIVESDMILCAVFPDGLAVTVRIAKNGELDLSDENLLDKIAKTVRLDDLGDTAGVGR